MKKILCSLCMILLLSGCSLSKYIPSKHFVETKYLQYNEVTYEYYEKQINGHMQKVFKLPDNLAIVKALLHFAANKETYEMYYERSANINIDTIISAFRSLSTQRMRIFYGSSSDFEMIKVEWQYSDEHVLAKARVQDLATQLVLEGDIDIVKIKRIHDYLVQETKYDTQALSDEEISPDSTSLSPYGTLFLKLAVCEGYARTFMLFMQEFGIPCMIIESQTMNHAWNYVFVDGEWKFIDVTYDDPIPDNPRKVHYTYYLLNEEEFLAQNEHIFDDGIEIGLNLEQYKVLANVMFPQTQP